MPRLPRAVAEEQSLRHVNHKKHMSCNPQQTGYESRILWTSSTPSLSSNTVLQALRKVLDLVPEVAQVSTGQMGMRMLQAKALGMQQRQLLRLLADVPVSFLWEDYCAPPPMPTPRAQLSDRPHPG